LISTVVFDLDGTLTDSAPGIISSLRYAFDALGLARLDAAQERAFVGPPLHESFGRLVPADLIDAGIAAYREHYVPTGMFQNTVYDGVVDLLDAIAAQGVTMAVATSKAEPFAVRILEHFGIAGAFATIRGSRLDGTTGGKAEVLQYVLDDLGNPPRDSLVMVGDREHDVHGAAAHNIACYGAAWGYGGPGELSRAGAVAVLESPFDLIAALATQ
jgi:phosphoglycolate phosphatase